MRQPELFGEHKCFADADHRNRKHHVVADLGRLPMFSRIGFAAANAGAAPPAMKVSVAPLAPVVPPDTGASTDGRLRLAARPCAVRALSTSTVEQSITSAPLAAAGTTSVHTDT